MNVTPPRRAPLRLKHWHEFSGPTQIYTLAILRHNGHSIEELARATGMPLRHVEVITGITESMQWRVEL